MANLAYRKPASASSSMAGFGPQGAVDGSGASLLNPSRWVSNNSTAGEWLEVDLLYYGLVTSFTIYNGNNTGTDVQNLVRNVDIQIDVDGIWQTVAQIRDNTQSMISVTLPQPVKTSKARLYFPIAEAQYRIFEFEVNGERTNVKRAHRYPKKNLFNVKLFDSIKYVGGGTMWMYVFQGKPNTQYTFSTNAPYTEGGLANFYAGGVVTSSNGYKAGSPVTITSKADGTINMYTRNENTSTPSDASQKLFSGEYWIQVEEGTVATAYEPFTRVNKPAITYTKKNLIPDRDLVVGGWVGTNSIDSSSNNSMMRAVPVKIPVKKGEYFLSSKYTDVGAGILLFRTETGQGIILYSSSAPIGSVSVPYDGFLTIHIRRLDGGAWDRGLNVKDLQLQLEPGTAKTAYEPIKTVNKPVNLYPARNQVPFDQTKWTKRAGTTYATFNGNRITYDGNQDYAGVQILLDDKKFVGKQITFGGSRHPDTGILFFYKKSDGTGAYIGLASYEAYRTLTIPAGASECRFYIQNNPGTRGEFWAENLFVNFGADPVFEPYKEGHKPAKLYLKNFIRPLDTWSPDASTTVNYLERKPDRVTIEITRATQYGAILMPINMAELKPLLGQTVTLSARGLERYGYNVTVALRFYGGASGNKDMTLNSNLTRTDMIPTDATQAFVKIQNSGIGYSKITVDRLQLEIGANQTEYSPYGLKNKPLAN